MVGISFTFSSPCLHGISHMVQPCRPLARHSFTVLDMQGRGPVARVGGHGDFSIRRPTWWVGAGSSCVDMGGDPSLSFRFRVEAWPLHHGCTRVASQILFRAGNCTHSSRKEKGPLVGLPLSTTCVCCERCLNRGPWDLGRAALDRVDLAGCWNRPLAGP